MTDVKMDLLHKEYCISCDKYHRVITLKMWRHFVYCLCPKCMIFELRKQLDKRKMRCGLACNLCHELIGVQVDPLFLNEWYICKNCSISIADNVAELLEFYLEKND